MARAVRGAAAGVVATAAMTVLMVASDRGSGMPDEPPRRIVDRLALSLDDRTADLAALVAHVGYGAGAGAVFAALPGRRGPALGAGLAYALALWAMSYEGWVPAIGALPPAHRDHRGRVVTMVAAHAVFGLVLGALARR